MTANRPINRLDPNPLSWLAVGLVLVFAIATFLLTRPAFSPQSVAPVSGLMTLRASARDAVPYAVAMRDHKPMLLEFYADWCTTCQAMAPVLQAVRGEFGDRVNFVMLNIDEAQWRQPVEQFQVTGVPALILLDSAQTPIEQFVGKVPHAILTRRIAELLAQQPRSANADAASIAVNLEPGEISRDRS